jgi:hypothetical protein
MNLKIQDFIKKNKIIVIAIAMLILIASSIGFYYYYTGNSDNSMDTGSVGNNFIVDASQTAIATISDSCTYDDATDTYIFTFDDGNTLTIPKSQIDIENQGVLYIYDSNEGDTGLALKVNEEEVDFKVGDNGYQVYAAVKSQGVYVARGYINGNLKVSGDDATGTIEAGRACTIKLIYNPSDITIIATDTVDESETEDDLEPTFNVAKSVEDSFEEQLGTTSDANESVNIDEGVSNYGNLIINVKNGNAIVSFDTQKIGIASKITLNNILVSKVHTVTFYNIDDETESYAMEIPAYQLNGNFKNNEIEFDVDTFKDKTVVTTQDTIVVKDNNGYTLETYELNETSTITFKCTNGVKFDLYKTDKFMNMGDKVSTKTATQQKVEIKQTQQTVYYVAVAEGYDNNYDLMLPKIKSDSYNLEFTMDKTVTDDGTNNWAYKQFKVYSGVYSDAGERLICKDVKVTVTSSDKEGIWVYDSFEGNTGTFKQSYSFTTGMNGLSQSNEFKLKPSTKITVHVSSPTIISKTITYPASKVTESKQVFTLNALPNSYNVKVGATTYSQLGLSYLYVYPVQNSESISIGILNNFLSATIQNTASVVSSYYDANNAKIYYANDVKWDNTFTNEISDVDFNLIETYDGKRNVLNNKISVIFDDDEDEKYIAFIVKYNAKSGLTTKHDIFVYKVTYNDYGRHQYSYVDHATLTDTEVNKFLY